MLRLSCVTTVRLFPISTHSTYNATLRCPPHHAQGLYSLASPVTHPVPSTHLSETSNASARHRIEGNSQSLFRCHRLTSIPPLQTHSPRPRRRRKKQPPPSTEAYGKDRGEGTETHTTPPPPTPYKKEPVLSCFSDGDLFRDLLCFFF